MSSGCPCGSLPILTLVVSPEAILSTFILISENRQARLDERRNHLDLQINLLAEQENTKTLQLLEQIAKKLGVDATTDPDVKVLEQATRPDRLLEQIDKGVKQAGQKVASLIAFFASAFEFQSVHPKRGKRFCGTSDHVFALS